MILAYRERAYVILLVCDFFLILALFAFYISFIGKVTTSVQREREIKNVESLKIL